MSFLTANQSPSDSRSVIVEGALTLISVQHTASLRRLRFIENLAGKKKGGSLPLLPWKIRIL